MTERNGTGPTARRSNDPMSEPRDQQPIPEELFYDWFKTFYLCLRENKSRLLLNNLELEPINVAWAELKEVAEELGEKREEVERKKEAARRATEELEDAQRGLTRAVGKLRDTKAQADIVVRPMALKIYRNSRVTEVMKAELGLPGYYPPPAPHPPILQGEARDESTNYLEWDPNGNPEGTRYVVKCVIISPKDSYHTARQSPVAADLDRPGATLAKTTDLYHLHDMRQDDGTPIEWSQAWYLVAVLDAYDREIPELRSNAVPVNRGDSQGNRPGFFGGIFSKLRPK
jgi:hypothetical protein